MKIKGKIAIVCVILVLSIAAPAFSQVGFSLDEISKTMDEFSENVAKALPFNSSMGLNWADAYIGNFPRFGAGLSLGFTTMDDGSLTNIMEYFDISLPSFVSGFSGYPVPGYTFEARLGGFGLPFDIGFKFGTLPLESINYLLVGGDVRFAILKQNVILPAISLGIGFNYMEGGIERSIGKDINYSYNPTDPSYYITVTKPTVNIDWSASSLDFKAQISKSFVIFTPYLGIGASTGWSKANVDVTMKTETGPELEQLKQIFKEGIGIDLNDKGFHSETEKPKNGWSFRLFGGLSFNVTVFRIELTGFYNFDKWGATLGARIQL